MNANQIAVSHIEIKIRDNTLRLSPEEFRELRDILNATFPAEVKWYPTPAPVYIPPITIPMDTPYPWRHWEVTCQSGVCGDGASTVDCQTMCLALR